MYLLTPDQDPVTTFIPLMTSGPVPDQPRKGLDDSTNTDVVATPTPSTADPLAPTVIPAFLGDPTATPQPTSAIPGGEGNRSAELEGQQRPAGTRNGLDLTAERVLIAAGSIGMIKVLSVLAQAAWLMG